MTLGAVFPFTLFHRRFIVLTWWVSTVFMLLLHYASSFIVNTSLSLVVTPAVNWKLCHIKAAQIKKFNCNTWRRRCRMESDTVCPDYDAACGSHWFGVEPPHTAHEPCFCSISHRRIVLDICWSGVKISIFNHCESAASPGVQSQRH